MEAKDAAELAYRVDEDNLDADRFATIWSVASATMQGDLASTRQLASRLLGFLCSKRCPFVVVSRTDAKYLDDWFERDNSLLYDWSTESEKVDLLSQHAYVPFDLLGEFLRANKFNPESNYSPRRAVRTAWFNEDWNVG